MAILWGEKQQSRKASETLETGSDSHDTSKLTFEKVYIVLGDSPDEDMIEAVKNISEIPSVGDRDGKLGSCVEIEVAESDFIPDSEEGNGKPVYEVTVKYDTSADADKDDGKDDGSSSRDPKELWQQPDQQVPNYNLPNNSIRWTYEEHTTPLYVDYNGRYIQNANLERFELECNDDLLVAEITCYTLRNVEVDVLTKYNNTINENVFAGYDPFRIKLNISCDYEDIDLGDDNHTICKWKKFVLKFIFDGVKKGTIKAETVVYNKTNGDQYANTINTAGNEIFLTRIEHTGTKVYNTTSRRVEKIRTEEKIPKVYIDLATGVYKEEPTMITFQTFRKSNFSELSAYLDCDIEEWLEYGLESNAGEKLESIMKRMRNKNKKRNKKRTNEINEEIQNSQQPNNQEEQE